MTVLATPDPEQTGCVVDEGPYYSPGEFAAMLGINPRTVHRWIAKGVIPAVKIEQTVRISASVLPRFSVQVSAEKAS